MTFLGNVTATNASGGNAARKLAAALGFEVSAMVSSMGHLPSQTQDRLSGALLGLRLLPIAYASTTCVSPSADQTLEHEVASYFRQIERFLSDGFRRYAASDKPANLSQLCPYLLPILLRYPGDSGKVTQLLAGCDAHLVASALVFGDAIALAMSGYIPPHALPLNRKPNPLQYFRHRIERQRLSPAVKNDYMQLWADLLSNPEKSAFLGKTLAQRPQLTVAENNRWAPLTVGILSAMPYMSASFLAASAIAQPQHHSLAIQQAYAATASLSASSRHTAAAIAGLLTGALGGTAPLSVLWQVGITPQGFNTSSKSRLSTSPLSLPSRQQTLALSTHLFNQWAGIFPACQTANPSASNPSASSPFTPSSSSKN